jgi:ABC-type branched-subunit amino acid transport system ATPase component
MDFPKITNKMNISKVVQKYDITNIPTSTAEKKSIMCNIQLKIYLKHLTVKKNLKECKK